MTAFREIEVTNRCSMTVIPETQFFSSSYRRIVFQRPHCGNKPPTKLSLGVDEMERGTSVCGYTFYPEKFKESLWG